MMPLVTTLLLAALTVGSLYWWELRPRDLVLRPIAWTPVPEVSPDGVRATLPVAFYVAEVGRYDDELTAYLMFDYLRGAPPLARAEVLLTHEEGAEGPEYPILVRLPDDLALGIAMLAETEARGYIPSYDWRAVAFPIVFQYRQQTRVFTSAYNLPRRAALESLPREALLAYARRFMVFKSATDPRIRRRIEPVPQSLSPEEASRLAADVLTVADFFEIPIDFFLGIGAMENNYMDVRGDLENTKWKRRAEKGDIVLRRSKGRVLVLNYSTGVWQITRETLRYAHRLYLRDKERDYTRLPERMRPPKALNLDEVDTPVLTTYAGLFFRDLLDTFDGDVALAVGAYNGGPGRPNPKYEEGVRQVAVYARRMMEQAAALHGQRAAETSYFAPPRAPRGR
ncbi:MAG: hypothetical protein IPM24_14690 [Bryobacterales bacterium]|nr:hypothetical protein [Bryobacterales bacterium]